MAAVSALVVYSGGKVPDLGALASRGIAARCVPSHRIELNSLTFPARSKVDRLLFTSRNAVEAFRKAGFELYEGAIVHAVGEATAEALRSLGRTAAVPDIASAEGLLESLPPRLDGEFVFWPRGDDAELRLAEELRARGADVYAPAIYRKVELPFPADLPVEIEERKYAAFACTSGAAARWLYRPLRPEQAAVLNSLPAAVLGERTAGVLRGLGAKRIVAAPEASFTELVETLASTLSV